MQSPLTPPDSQLSALRMRLLMLLVSGAMFMEILDGSIITTALPAMAHSFGRSAVALNLGISAYLLTLGVFIPASGWVADRVGARRVFAWAIAGFTLSSLVCGVSARFDLFVALRIVQGIAGAMMVPVGRLLVLRFTPQHKLLPALSSLVWPALIAPVLGPPLGGFITTQFGWRWIFYINLPLGLLALVATLWLVPDVREAATRRFDWSGFTLFGSGILAALCGLESLVDAADWSGAALLLGGLAVLALALLRMRSSPAPLIDLRPARIPTLRVALRGGAWFRIAINSAPFLLPLLFQIGFGYDAFHSGMLVLAVFAGNLGMKSMVKRVLGGFGYRSVMIWNGWLCTLSLALCAALSPHWPLAWTLLLLVGGGMSRSMQFTVIGTMAYADVPKPQMSDASSLFNTSVQLTNAAAITLGALCVRAGHALTAHAGMAPSAQFRVAFVLMAGLSLFGQIDARRLSRDAAAHLIAPRG